MTDDGEQLSFLRGPLPVSCQVRMVVLPPLGTLAYQRRQWADALVVVEYGTLEVECDSEVRARFEAGAVLTFATLNPRRLLNPGTVPLVLSALIRSSGR